MKKISKNHFVYIVECNDSTYYCGYTINLENRLKNHNSSPSGAKYTKSRRPVKLVYCEKHKTIKSALQRELAIKKLPRKQKQLLISTYVKD